MKTTIAPKFKVQNRPNIAQKKIDIMAHQALNTGTAPKTDKDLIGAQKAKKVLIRDQTLSWT